jgi:hypothetical protein
VNGLSIRINCDAAPQKSNNVQYKVTTPPGVVTGPRTNETNVQHNFDSFLKEPNRGVSEYLRAAGRRGGAVLRVAEK